MSGKSVAFFGRNVPAGAQRLALSSYSKRMPWPWKLAGASRLRSKRVSRDPGEAREQPLFPLMYNG